MEITASFTDKGLHVPDSQDRALLQEWRNKGYQIKITPIKKQGSRTMSQNAALHLMFQWVADEVNNSGLTMKDLAVDVDLPINSTTIKEFWRAIQKDQLGKDSTTKLGKSEIDIVFNVFARTLADKGVEIQFPSQEKRSLFFEALDMRDKLDYPIYEEPTI